LRKPIVCYVLMWLLLVPALSAEARAQESPRDVVEAYRVWKLTKALDLSEEQMPVFFARLREVEKAAEDFKQEEHEALKDMARLLEDKAAAEADLAGALGRYEEMRRKHREDAVRLRSEATSMLSMRQRCEFAVFEERFRSELRDMVTRVREMRAERRMEERARPKGPRSP
jgi:hypothetical protein